MSDRRAVSAGHLAASSVAAEPWRVAVGGNRVESMSVEQIAQAFHAGHLTVRTPLWPPGTSGWQALGNFEQFQMAAQHGGAYDDHQDGLAQFEEADDDPTRMWTGSSDLEMGGGNMGGMAMQAPPPSPPPVMRPSARTGPRQVSQRPPQPPTSPSMRAQPMMAQPPMRVTSAASSVSPSAPPQFRRRGSSGWLLVAGLVGLVGLGSAVLAARGSWSAAAPSVPVPTAEAPSTETSPSVAEPAAKDAPEEVAAAPAAAAAEAEPAKTEAAEAAQPEAAQLAKYDDTQASAFVAGVEPSKVDKTGTTAAASSAKVERATAAPEKQEVSSASRRLAAANRAEKAERAKAERAERAAERAEKAAAAKEQREKAAASKRAVAAVAPPPAPAAAPKQPKAEAPAPAAEPANASVNEAAAAALATSANLASSCRPRGGPSGAGKTRVIYSQDGEVQSVEILTAKFRDTLTGSCVKMVFRRAKIPAFKGEPPTFIKSFTIPEE